MPYATVGDMEALFGEPWLRQFAGMPNRDTLLSGWLTTADGEINSALTSAGYPAPLTDDDILPERLAEVRALLALHASTLAASYLLARSNDLPGGVKQMIEATRSWLARLAAGKVEVPGASRRSEEISQRATAEGVGFVSFDDVRDNFPGDFHSRLRRLW